MTKVGWYAVDKSTTLESNKSLTPLPQVGADVGGERRVWKTKKHRGGPIKKVVPRCQAERTVAWFQKKYRRLVVRWERIAACFDAFLAIATIHIWVHRLIVG